MLPAAPEPRSATQRLGRKPTNQNLVAATDVAPCSCLGGLGGPSESDSESNVSRASDSTTLAMRHRERGERASAVDVLAGDASSEHRVMTLEQFKGKRFPSSSPETLRSQSQFPGHLRPRRMDEDAMSTASITSRASASASLAHLHKYERPMQKYTLDQALAGCDMSSALSQIRTSKTRAKADNSPLAEELECHERCLTSGQELVLSRMVLFELQVAFAHEKQIRNKLEGGQLPAPFFCDIKIRQALELIPPKCKEFQPGFIEALTPCGIPARYDVRNPSMCSEVFTDEDKKGMIPRHLRSALNRHVYMPLVNQGQSQTPNILKVAELMVLFVDTKVDEDIVSFYDPIRKDARALLLVYAKTPYAHGSSIDDHEFFVSDEGSKELVGALKAHSTFNRALQCSNMLDANERGPWEQVESYKKKLQEIQSKQDVTSEDIQCIDEVLSKYASWKALLRGEALPNSIQPILSEVIIAEAKKITVGSLDGEEWLKRLRHGHFVDHRFGPLIDNLDRQAKFVSSRKATTALETACDGLLKSDRNEDGDAWIAALQRIENALPDSGSKISFEQGAVSLTCWKAFALMLDTALQSSWGDFQRIIELATTFKRSIEHTETYAGDRDQEASVQWGDFYSDTEAGLFMYMRLSVKCGAVISLDQSLQAYQRLGDIDTERQEHKDALGIVESIQQDVDKFKEIAQFNEKVTLSSDLSSEIDRIMPCATQIAEAFGKFYCKEKEPPVLAAHAALNQMPVLKWHDDVPEDSSVSELIEKTEGSLCALDEKGLLEATKALDVAMKNYEARASKFAIGSDSYSELKAKIDDTLLSARTTIVENKLMTNLKESAYDLEDAIDDINCQIAPKALRAAGIVPSEHFHKCLWSTVQSVLKGKRIDQLVQ